MAARLTSITLSIWIAIGSSAQAQLFRSHREATPTPNWAQRVFDSLDHDFQSVARGAEAHHVFTLTNPYRETVHVSSIEKTCGCTSATIDKTTLASHEEAHLKVMLDTKRFVGQKDFTVTVTFDQPFYAQVRLKLSGYIRGDVVLEPGSIVFGTIDQGRPAERKVQIAYAGRSDWRIEAVEGASPYVETTLSPPSQKGNRTDYQLTVRLEPDAPAGYLRDQLRLITNDRQKRELPLVVEARIEPAVNINPSTLFLGTLSPGQSVTRPVVIRARQPFRVIDIEIHADNEAFTTKLPEEAREVQVIPITFTAGAEPGKCTGQFRLLTDLDSTPALEFTAYAQVKGGTS